MEKCEFTCLKNIWEVKLEMDGLQKKIIKPKAKNIYDNRSSQLRPYKTNIREPELASCGSKDQV